MPIVDSHCHVSPSWYEPVESLVYQMDQNGVDHAVLIQMMGQYNNLYQFECMRRYPGRFASVVVVDTAQLDAVEALRRLAGDGASGVRLRAATRSEGDDPYAIWRAVDELGLAVSCMGNPKEFIEPDFAALAEAFPGLPMVIEHLGSLKYADRDPEPTGVAARLCELARYPNLFMKVPGLGEFCFRSLPVVEPFP